MKSSLPALPWWEFGAPVGPSQSSAPKIFDAVVRVQTKRPSAPKEALLPPEVANMLAY
jgi:hypothetical protein